MAPFKTFSKVLHITSMLWVAASHYLEEERLSDKVPVNWGSTGQFPWKNRFSKLSYASLYTRLFCIVKNNNKNKSPKK